jgi:hypothetical protein
MLGLDYDQDSDDELNEMLADDVDKESNGTIEDFLDEEGNDMELIEEGFIV